MDFNIIKNRNCLLVEIICKFLSGTPKVPEEITFGRNSEYLCAIKGRNCRLGRNCAGNFGVKEESFRTAETLFFL